MVAGTKYENVHSDVQQENQPGTIKKQKQKNEADENSILEDEGDIVLSGNYAFCKCALAC